MKKFVVFLLLFITVLTFASCKEDQESSKDEPKLPVSGEGDNTEEGSGEDGSKDEETDDGENLIAINEYLGLNEQIFVSIKTEENHTYKAYYKCEGDEDFTEVDSRLLLVNGDSINCYILGLKSGKYQVKIKAECNGEGKIRTLRDIEVETQDRSGYAHFNYSEGVGAYNNDGTVKDGAKIVYVTNENKNTVTVEINGTTYIGLVKILQAQYKSDTPLLIRVIGSIKTNQWNYKNVAPRLTDGSNLTDDFFENTFSNEYGENLANLKVKFTDKKDGKTHNFTTTPGGLSSVRITGSNTSTTNYKGSDFPALSGERVYDDDSYYNMIEVQAAKNVTIEGVGPGAEFFQFGVGFEKCQSIEVKNLTFTSYPEDALNFMSENDVTAFGNYWVHNNTFNPGYNAWDISGERDKFAGDGTIDMAFVHNVTVSYNKFNQCKKTMLVGNSDSSRCMNITLHHNYFYKVNSRIPLCRNTNVHIYNNYFEECNTCSDVRVKTYLFSEANYYKSTKYPFKVSGGAVKSFGDIGFYSITGVVKAADRTKIVNNSCKPDGKTDYSKFDTNPSLFYYDAENRKTIASVMLEANEVPDFVKVYAGAGCAVKLDVAD